jgi:hypothetical protein
MSQQPAVLKQEIGGDGELDSCPPDLRDCKVVAVMSGPE